MSTTPKLKLYFAPATRSTRVRHLLEELEVPYELVVVDMGEARDHKKPEYIANVHPHGAVPALDVDGMVMIESGAIVAYLADRFLEKKLAPALDAPERAAYMQWLFYAYATLEPAINAAIKANKPDPSASLSDEQKAKDMQRWSEITGVMTKQLESHGKPWFLGEFSALDAIYGGLLVWANAVKLLEDRPAVKEYAERIKSRPAFQKARKV